MKLTFEQYVALTHRHFASAAIKFVAHQSGKSIRETKQFLAAIAASEIRTIKDLEAEANRCLQLDRESYQAALNKKREILEQEIEST